MEREPETTLERLFAAVWNDENPALADELVHPAYVVHDRALAEQFRGPELYRALASETRESFPDASFEIEDVVADGDRVACRWTMTGTHEGEVYDVAPTGELVAMEGIEIDRFEDGRLAETWARSDQLGLLGRIGGLPAGRDG